MDEQCLNLCAVHADKAEHLPIAIAHARQHLQFREVIPYEWLEVLDIGFGQKVVSCAHGRFPHLDDTGIVRLLDGGDTCLRLHNAMIPSSAVLRGASSLYGHPSMD